MKLSKDIHLQKDYLSNRDIKALPALGLSFLNGGEPDVHRN
jgi:hypothetical protein